MFYVRDHPEDWLFGQHCTWYPALHVQKLWRAVQALDPSKHTLAAPHPPPAPPPATQQETAVSWQQSTPSCPQQWREGICFLSSTASQPVSQTSIAVSQQADQPVKPAYQSISKPISQSNQNTSQSTNKPASQTSIPVGISASKSKHISQYISQPAS